MSRRTYLFAAALVVVIGIGFAGIAWRAARPAALSVEEARLVGKWTKFTPDGKESSGGITFYPNRQWESGNTGSWSMRDGKLRLTYEPSRVSGESFASRYLKSMSPPRDFVDVKFGDAPDRVEVRYPGGQTLMIRTAK